MQTVPHILIAEDKQLVALALTELLSRRGFRVTVTHDGPAAIRADAADPADLLITDLRMPVLEGDHLITYIRQRRPALPIITMTAYSDAVPAEEPGRLIVLRKPFVLQGIADAAWRLLAADERRRISLAPPRLPFLPKAAEKVGGLAPPEPGNGHQPIGGFEARACLAARGPGPQNGEGARPLLADAPGPGPVVGGAPQEGQVATVHPGRQSVVGRVPAPHATPIREAVGRNNQQPVRPINGVLPGGRPVCRAGVSVARALNTNKEAAGGEPAA